MDFPTKGTQNRRQTKLVAPAELTLNTANQPPKVPWFSVSLKTCAVIIDF